MSILSKLLGKVSDHAPLIGTLLGGPAMGKVLPIVSSILGVKNSEDEVVRALQTDPQAYAKLKEAELRHQQKLEELQLEETMAFLKDTESARDREVAYVKATGGRDWFQAIYGTLIILSFIGVLVATFTLTVPVGSDRVLGTLIGILGTLTIQVANYLYGTSKSSAAKTATLNEQLKNGVRK